jgi:DNA-binding NtrC family response regulator
VRILDKRSLPADKEDMPNTVLIVEDELNIRIICSETLRAAGYDVQLAASGEQALELLDAQPIDIVLTDLKMPGMTGLDLLGKIREGYPGVDVVLMTAHATVATAVEALLLGAHDYLIKPFGVEDLTNRVNRLSERRELVADNAILREHLDTGRGPGGLVGTSAAMLRLYRTILKVGPRKGPALITGETGTGKELVAHAIHEAGLAPDSPFVPVDCAALSPTLIESELFGHLPGAFTGASQRRVGLLASAGNGTLFLDEIGELPLALQSKLLRAVQERQLRAVGSNRSERFEARIIAATNRQLEVSVKNGEFRSDLYFRLNVHSLHLPPLRDRKSDIPALVRFFMERAGNSDDSVTGISRGFMERLMQYSWPGNVRELQNHIERALASAEGPLLQVQDLALGLRCTTNERSGRTLTYLEEVERKAIAEVLDTAGGHRINAANLLGISRTTLYKKMRDYGLERGEQPQVLSC